MNRLRMLIQLELLGLSNEARTPAISGRSGHQIVLTRYLAGSPSNRIESPKSSLSMSADGPLGPSGSSQGIAGGSGGCSRRALVRSCSESSPFAAAARGPKASATGIAAGERARRC